MVDQAAEGHAQLRLRWRVCASSEPAPLLPLAQSVLAYQTQYIVDRGFGRFMVFLCR